MEQWCDSHEAAELEVAPRAGMRLLSVRLLLLQSVLGQLVVSLGSRMRCRVEMKHSLYGCGADAS